jgi:hypothetical protein
MSKLVDRAREWATEIGNRARADEWLTTPTRRIRLDNVEAGMLSAHLFTIADECERLEKELSKLAGDAPGTDQLPRGSASVRPR